MTTSGDLRHIVEFEFRSEDENGDLLGHFQPAFETWANLIWLRGGEGVVQQRLEGRQPVALVVRSNAMTRRIKSTWRAILTNDDDLVLNITSVSPAKERGFIDILATTGGVS